MQRLTMVPLAELYLMGASSLTLADDAVNRGTGQMKDQIKAERDAMKSEIKADKKEMKGPIMQYRKKMKTTRRDMIENIKMHREAAKTNPTAPAPTTTP